jgi:hypothetical protein
MAQGDVPPPDDEILALLPAARVVSIVDVVAALLGNGERRFLYADEVLAEGNRLVPEVRRADDWPGAPGVVVVRAEAGLSHFQELGVVLRVGGDGGRILLTILRENPFDDSVLADDPALVGEPDEVTEEEPFDAWILGEPEVMSPAAQEQPRRPTPPAESADADDNPFANYEVLRDRVDDE